MQRLLYVLSFWYPPFWIFHGLAFSIRGFCLGQRGVEKYRFTHFAPPVLREGDNLRMVRMSDFFLINKSWSGNMTFLIMVWNFYIFENGPNTVDGLADRRGCGVDHSSFLMSGRQIFSSRRTGGPTGVWGRPLIIFDEWSTNLQQSTGSTTQNCCCLPQ